MELRAINKSRAFTLVELLVVISIIAILMGILLPSLARARSSGKQIVCSSNLKQMGIAAGIYTMNNDGRFPLARMTLSSGTALQEISWDFEKNIDAGRVTQCKAGLLWQGDSPLEIQQCPMFKGAANSIGDPSTGYNYNASYIGGMYSTNPMTGVLTGINSTKEGELRSPANCAVFGDGQYGNGANKFMRSPFVGKLDVGLASLRPYGTQGFRHLGNTNVTHADGSVIVVKKRFVTTYNSLMSLVSEGTGFLSQDNRAYDLR